MIMGAIVQCYSRPGRQILALFAVLALALAWASPLAAAQKVALVIGNNAYIHAPALTNPVNDAKAVAKVLRSIGFDVVEHYDVTKTDADDIMEAFAQRTAKASIGLVYFAGHGIQVSGATFLVPVDVALESDRDMRRLIPADYFLQDASQAKTIGVVILDACRDNPFIKRLSEATAQTRSLTVGRGLSRIDAVPTKGLIAYATQAGNVALDSMGGKNSPYATALIKHLGAPNKDIRLVFGAVRDEVIGTTERQQEPYTYGSLGGDPIYLYEAATETSTTSTGTTTQGGLKDVTSLVPSTQLATSAPFSTTYVAWKSAVAQGSWEDLAKLAQVKDRSVFPLLAGHLGSMRAKDPALTVKQAMRALDRQSVSFSKMRPELAAMIQAQLRSLNYYAGDVDGRFGVNSKAAFDAFAQDWKRGAKVSIATIVALAERASERTAQSMFTGAWGGRYFYPRPLKGVKSVKFEMDLTFSQGRVTGFIVEPNTFGDKSSANLYASFSGKVAGNMVEWTKTYDGTAGINHSVLYRGTLDRAQRRIKGRWSIGADWSGDFNIELQ